MRLSSHSPLSARPASAPRAQAAAAPSTTRRVAADDGPPPEYSLWAILKDLGKRMLTAIKGLFGQND